MEKEKKKQVKRNITRVCVAVVILLLALMPMLTAESGEGTENAASILSGTVQTGSVTEALRGGGTLEAGSTEDISIPSGVKIQKFLVSNGDTVKAGAPLAAVDKVTVMSSIMELADTLDYLEGQMERTKDETVGSTITATAGGRVKAVYAEAGDHVQNVMLEHGSLAVLSLDGMMAVNLTGDYPVSTGDSVFVTLSDGAQIDGRVKSNLNRELVVTVEDEGYAIDEEVTVTAMDGSELGTGKLYVHNAWYATAFTGTISTVSAKEDTKVSSGGTLFTLTDTDFTAQYEHLSSLHRDYEALMQELFQMYETGYITAPCDGVISGVDKDSPHLLAAQEEQWQAELLNAESYGNSGENGWKLVLLSNITLTCTSDENCPLSPDSQEHNSDCIMACDRHAGCDAQVHHDDCITLCISSDGSVDCPALKHYPSCIESCTHASSEGEACPSTKYHYADCIKNCVIGTGTKECTASVHYKACIKSCDKTENCPGTMNHYPECVRHCTRSDQCDAINHYGDCPMYGVTYTAYAAKVFSVGDSIVAYADTATVYTVTATDSGWTLDQPLRTDLMITMTTIPAGTPCNAGDIILVMEGTRGDEVVVSNKVIVYQKGSGSEIPGEIPGGDIGGIGGFPSTGMPSFGMSGGIGSFGGSTGGSSGNDYELFDLDGEVLMTLTSQESMTLSIAIDERDIGKMAVGQTAQVKVNALKDQAFEAVVTKVGVVGANSGGSSKFDVELTLDKGEDMLDGMSATAEIPLDVKENIPVIPVKALAQIGADTVVYTALDQNTGLPTAPVTVQLGISDAQNAEILSGLNAGDTYYYTYYDAPSEETK